MHSQYTDKQSIEIEPTQFHVLSPLAEPDTLVTQSPYSTSEYSQFYGYFQDGVEMYAEPERVTAYLDTHQNWFRRCAHPMKAEPLGQNGYALVIGRFGSFGYEVEPKIGLELLPQQDGIYRIQTIPVPDYIPPGYEVDFQASQICVAIPSSEYFREQDTEGIELPPTVTRIEWELHLTVRIRFPKFIQKLPQSLVQSTGDRVLRQIVRQVSRRLSSKVQEDFHHSLGISMPKPLKRRL
ncbi:MULTISPECIES: DUF1997 domain-containing protein [unclassified Coleofasciculus]|uniref:DUF1997 domain-containing protein n=1 Tax=unclassified Coleofasciculus TaxID=2692782 RepID=UPI001880B29C|nr:MULTISPECIES: DUF1997 domain-containing protein [unclassified Coleofasciculus]MBE9127597.1 DUF1997 domain-containing protein [Coleofasciculus sp. LEGE 07081]MBE9150932.1 DUF1997 domain-containing protein [Coleofasciculus sp. LEGE 07092]